MEERRRAVEQQSSRAAEPKTIADCGLRLRIADRQGKSMESPVPKVGVRLLEVCLTDVFRRREELDARFENWLRADG
jgi:hypothetical protein